MIINCLPISQNTFKVCPESERVVLTSAGMKWRQFKTKLTTKYVLPFLGHKKKLARPPKQYAFVGKEHWKNFVKLRTCEQWKVYAIFQFTLISVNLCRCYYTTTFSD